MLYYSHIQDVISKVENAVNNQSPLSLIRLGDGENSIIGYPDFTSRERLNHVLQRAFGKYNYSLEELEHLILGLRDSVENADIIGTYSKNHDNIHCSCGYQQIEHYKLLKNNQIFTEAGINLIFHEKKIYQKILNKVDRLGIITCRPISHIFEEKFKLDVDCYSVPQEHNFSKVSGENASIFDRPHFPDIYTDIMQSLDVSPGQVFFVGAGPVGKLYCAEIKRRSGIALDVGAMFDMWLKIPTRTPGFMKRAWKPDLMIDYEI